MRQRQGKTPAGNRTNMMGTLMDLLKYQTNNSIDQQDLLLFLCVYNTSLALSIIERRALEKGGATVGRSADPLAVLGQLLGKQEGGSTNLISALGRAIGGQGGAKSETSGLLNMLSALTSLTGPGDRGHKGGTGPDPANLINLISAVSGLAAASRSGSQTDNSQENAIGPSTGENPSLKTLTALLPLVLALFQAMPRQGAALSGRDEKENGDEEAQQAADSPEQDASSQDGPNLLGLVATLGSLMQSLNAPSSQHQPDEPPPDSDEGAVTPDGKIAESAADVLPGDAPAQPVITGDAEIVEDQEEETDLPPVLIVPPELSAHSSKRRQSKGRASKTSSNTLYWNFGRKNS